MTVLAEVVLKEGYLHRIDVTNCCNADSFHACLGYMSNPRDATHRQRQQKTLHLVRLNDEQTIWLLPIGRDLRQKLVRRHASGGRQVKLLTNLLTNHLRDTRRCWKLHLVLGQIQVGFVERKGFDQVCMPLKDFADRLRDCLVSSEVRRYKD